MNVRPAKPEELSWLAERVRVVLPPTARGILAERPDGTIAGMVAYEGWMPNSCQVHMAVDTPIVWRHLLPAAFQYPFEQVGLGVLIGIVNASNEKAVAMNRHLGFRLGHVIRDGVDVGTDLYIFEMRREECRFLKARKAA